MHEELIANKGWAASLASTLCRKCRFVPQELWCKLRHPTKGEIVKFRIVLIGLFIATSALAIEKPLNVPSDSRAQFFILEKNGKGAERTIVTKRVGSSGTSFSKRLYNCNDNTVKYLGTGDTLTEMATSKSDLNMASIVQGSIAYYVGVEACK